VAARRGLASQVNRKAHNGCRGLVAAMKSKHDMPISAAVPSASAVSFRGIHFKREGK